MRRAIVVIDSSSGERQQRASDTPTLDVPADLRRPRGVVSVDADSQAHYVKSSGEEVDYPAFVRPLSWRALGEQCLVAKPGCNGRRAGFRLSVVERLPEWNLPSLT